MRYPQYAAVLTSALGMDIAVVGFVRYVAGASFCILCQMRSQESKIVAYAVYPSHQITVQVSQSSRKAFLTVMFHHHSFHSLCLQIEVRCAIFVPAILSYV